jgi:hypothetical protein
VLSEFVRDGREKSVFGVDDARPDVVQHERAGAVSALGLKCHSILNYCTYYNITEENFDYAKICQIFSSNVHALKLVNASREKEKDNDTCFSNVFFKVYDKQTQQSGVHE